MWRYLVNRWKLSGTIRWFVEWEGKTWLIEVDAGINVTGGANILEWFGVECWGIEGIYIVE